MPPDVKPPIGEKGTAVTVPMLPGTPGWGYFQQAPEAVAEWAWPGYTATVDDMLNDGQVWSLFMGTILPLLEYDWWIDPNGADGDFTAALAADLGLPVDEPEERGGPIAPGLYRFSFTEHLWEALLAFAYGHYYFEQVAEDPTKTPDGLAHLRKLAPRPPSTIGEILTDNRGGLRAIRQHGVVVTNTRGALLAMDVPEVRVDRLVAYVWLPDGRRRWIGRPMLRPLYQGFLVNDRLARVDAINHERAGGVPGFETDESYAGADLTELRQLASQFRVGEESGWASPAGSKMVIAKGGGTDVVGSMRYHDEKMARAWGQMLKQLGQTQTGSRALGDTFADVEALVRRSIARWFTATFREHVIEDWFGWNVPGFAEQAQGQSRPPHPLLRFRPPAIEGSDEPVPVPGGAPAPEPFPVAARARWGCGGGSER